MKRTAIDFPPLTVKRDARATEFEEPLCIFRWLPGEIMSLVLNRCGDLGYILLSTSVSSDLRNWCRSLPSKPRTAGFTSAVERPFSLSLSSRLNAMNLYYLAAREGHLNLMAWAKRSRVIEEDRVTPLFTGTDAGCKPLDSLPNGMDGILQLDAEAGYVAAIKGNLECLIYAHMNGCTWDVNIAYMAIMGDNRDCLRYALENDIPLSSYGTTLSIISGSVRCLSCLLSGSGTKTWKNYVNSKLTEKHGDRMCYYAIKSRQLNSLMCCFRFGHRPGFAALLYVMANPNFAIFRYMYRHGCFPDEGLFEHHLNSCAHRHMQEVHGKAADAIEDHPSASVPRWDWHSDTCVDCKEWELIESVYVNYS